MLAIGAMGATSASAANYNVHSLPEVGRCVKVAAGKGVYKGPRCITRETKGLGAYEWIPANESEKLTFTGSGLESILTAVGHPTIKCTSAKITGTYKGPKTATVQIEFLGCTNSLGAQCQSGTNKSEIKTLSLEAEIGFIKDVIKEGKLILVVGLDLNPTSPVPNLILYECGKITESARVEGAVIGKMAPLNGMTTKLSLTYTAVKGVQQYEKFENGLKDTLTTTFQSGLNSTSAASSLTIKKEIGSNGVALEIKAREN
jgi:hypothetical protein